MAKRGHGEGTVSQMRDGRWQGRVRYTDPVTGKQGRKAVYGTTIKEARDNLKKIIREIEQGAAIDAGRMTLGRYLDQWLENHVKRSRKITTWENYEAMVRLHIKPALGHIALTKLQTSDLEKLYNEKLDHGRSDKKGGLSSKTVGLVHLVCHLALEQAVKEGLVTRNVATSATTPQKIKKEIKPMTEEQITRFLTVIKEDRWFAAFYLLIATGMRRGEVLGLKWSDIDFEVGALQIQRSLVKTSTEKAKFHPPKTAKSQRRIPLTDDVVETLKCHKSRQDVERSRLGDLYDDSNMVFCREDGVPLYPDVLDNKFHTLLAKAELPHFRVHDLRHTFATIMLKQDVHAKIVQEILGHSTIGVTLDTYSHILPGIKDQAMKKMQSVLSGEAVKPDAQTDAQNDLQRDKTDEDDLL